MFVFAQVFNDTTAATWLARDAGVTTVQYQPVMRIDFKLVGDKLE